MTARLIRDRGWELVAAYNRAGPKIGKDLGRVAGLDEDLGVVVQDYETADYDSLDVDIAVIAGPDYLDEAFPIYERFLRAGINVLSYGSHAYEPRMFHPEIAERIEALAVENGVTFTGSGLWDMTRIWTGIMATGPCVRLDSLNYSTDTEALRQGLHWAPLIGVGMTVEEFDEKIGREVGRLNHVLQIPARIVLEHLGYTVSNVSMRQEPVVFDEPVYSEHLEEHLPAGVCVGTRTLIDVETEQGVSSRSRFDYRVFKPGEIEHGTWKVDGSPGFEVRIVREDSGVASASSLLNRVPEVLAAEPGIVTIMDLGPERPAVLV
jgi:4-hydroxy-tetrahydrodipicolinate reductase